jgi:hypothetical protein
MAAFVSEDKISTKAMLQEKICVIWFTSNYLEGI